MLGGHYTERLSFSWHPTESRRRISGESEHGLGLVEREQLLNWFLHRTDIPVSESERAEMLVRYEAHLNRLLDVNDRTLLRIAVSLGRQLTIEDLDAACMAELEENPHFRLSYVYPTAFSDMTREEALETAPFEQTGYTDVTPSGRAYDIWTRHLSTFVAEYEPARGTNAMARTRAWIEQFDRSSRVALLESLTRTLRRTFIRRTDIEAYFQESIANEDFWRNVYLVTPPGYQGESGVIFTEVVRSCVDQKFGIDLFEDYELCWLNDDNHVFVDDAVFTGNRVLKDYDSDWRSWKRVWETPNGGTYERQLNLYVWTYLRHRSGEDWVRELLMEDAHRRGIAVSLTFRSKLVYEDRLDHADASDVLWPRHGANGVDSVDSDEETRARRPGRFVATQVFDDVRIRDVLEDQLLSAGRDIISRFNNTIWTPLGLGRQPFGFGSLSVSYRNCPNNAPLALWWSLQNWTALFPRDGYASRAERSQPVVIVPTRTSEEPPF